MLVVFGVVDMSAAGSVLRTVTDFGWRVYLQRMPATHGFTEMLGIYCRRKVGGNWLRIRFFVVFDNTLLGIRCFDSGSVFGKHIPEKSD